MNSFSRKKYDVLLIGSLCAFDQVFGEYLARKGMKICIVRIRSTSQGYITVPENFLKVSSLNDIIYIHSNKELVTLAKKSRAVVTFTGTFGMQLKWWWVFRRLLDIPPVFNVSTGSDFMELLISKGRVAWFYRYFTKTCTLNITYPCPYSLKSVVKTGLKNVLITKFPSYFLPEKPAQKSCNTGTLRYLHPSHLDFKVNDSGVNRTSAKGNDRFIRAFIKALNDGLDAECIILDRGPDRDVAREIINCSGYENRFIWKSHLSRAELMSEIMLADVIVDQFDVGILGNTAIEAMAMGKAVMIYLQKECMNMVYPEFPPVINACKEEEIYDQIMQFNSREKLCLLGEHAQRWIGDNHSWETCTDLFIIYYTLFTGHQVLNYGWDIDHYKTIAE